MPKTRGKVLCISSASTYVLCRLMVHLLRVKCDFGFLGSGTATPKLLIAEADYHKLIADDPFWRIAVETKAKVTPWRVDPMMGVPFPHWAPRHRSFVDAPLPPLD